MKEGVMKPVLPTELCLLSVLFGYSPNMQLEMMHKELPARQPSGVPAWSQAGEAFCQETFHAVFHKME